MLPEGLSWEWLQAIGRGLCLSVWTLSEFICACVLPYTLHVPRVGWCCCLRCVIAPFSMLFVCADTLAHTHTHRHVPTCASISRVSYEWTVNRDWGGCCLLPWEQQMCSFRPHAAMQSHTQAWRPHTHTPGSVFISPHPLSLSSPKATRPTYPQCTPATQTGVN